jgi:hypothetical protein
MKSIYLSALAFFTFSIFACAQTNEKMRLYFSYQNAGLEYYYVDSLVDSANKYLLKAESLYPNKRADMLYLIAEIYMIKKDKLKATLYLKASILAGYKPRFIPWDQDQLKTLVKFKPYEKLKTEADSLYASGLTSLDIDFMDFVQFMLGKDQAVRTIEYADYGMSDTTRTRMIKQVDSANYVEMRQYFDEKKPTNLPQKLWLSYGGGLCILIRHWIAGGLDSINENYFKNYMESQVNQGLLFDNMSITHAIDYKYLHNGDQVYGTNTTWDSDRKTIFAPIRNIKDVDSLRQTVNLPPLKVSAIMDGIELPVNYQYKSRIGREK